MPVTAGADRLNLVPTILAVEDLLVLGRTSCCCPMTT